MHASVPNKFINVINSRMRGINVCGIFTKITFDKLSNETFRCRPLFWRQLFSTMLTRFEKRFGQTIGPTYTRDIAICQESIWSNTIGRTYATYLREDPISQMNSKSNDIISIILLIFRKKESASRLSLSLSLSLNTRLTALYSRTYHGFTVARYEVPLDCSKFKKGKRGRERGEQTREGKNGGKKNRGESQQLSRFSARAFVYIGTRGNFKRPRQVGESSSSFEKFPA